MFYSNIPSLDLHGETSDTASVLVKEFINDNYKLKNNKVIIIHGIGSGVLKQRVHADLKKNRFVSNYYLDNFNIGCTVAELNVGIDKK